MATIGNLFVGVSADTTGLEQGMRRGAQATQQGAQQMAQSMLRVNGALNSTVMIASQMGLDTRIAMPMIGAAHVATDLAPKLAMAAGGLRAIGAAASTMLGPIGLAIAAVGAIAGAIVYLESTTEDDPLIDWFARLEADSAGAAKAIEGAMARVASSIASANAAAAGMGATDARLLDMQRTADLMAGGMSRGDAEAEVAIERQIGDAIAAQAEIEGSQLALVEERAAAEHQLRQLQANRLSGFQAEADMTDEELAAKATEVARRDDAIDAARRQLRAIDEQIAAAEGAKPFDEAFGPDAMRQQLQGIRDLEQSLEDMESAQQAAAKAAEDGAVGAVEGLLAERDAIEDAAAAADAARQGAGPLGDMGFMRSRDMSGAFGTGPAAPAEAAAAAAVAAPGGALEQIESALGGITVGGTAGNSEQRRLVELTEQMVKYLESIKAAGDEQVLA